MPGIGIGIGLSRFTDYTSIFLAGIRARLFSTFDYTFDETFSPQINRTFDETFDDSFYDW